MKRSVPRLMIAGTHSGGGKTTVTCALLTALSRLGLKTAAFKCGPDYIDPMFHTEVIGTKSRNLDLFLSDESTVRRLLAQNAADADIAVIEGVMGYYDGLAGNSTLASSWRLAQVTGTPSVLVVDCKGMSVSVAAQIKGFLQFRESGIRGVILNHVPTGVWYTELKELIESETGVKVYGHLPHRPQSVLQSRHLGLVTAEEVKNLKQKMDELGKQFRETVDVDALISLAKEAPPVEYEEQSLPVPEHEVRVAIAQDKAFCFYYRDSLDLLEQMGAKLVPFSPLSDNALPKRISGLLLGGGYPELYAKKLSENADLRKSIKEKLAGGLPCIAECGGYMYLQKSLQDEAGTKHLMVGALEGDCYKTEKLRRFGYMELVARRDGLLHEKGQTARAHEFHYWDSDFLGNGYTAKKQRDNQSWDCVHVTDTMYAGYPHLYLAADPDAVRQFVGVCAAYAGRQL